MQKFFISFLLFSLALTGCSKKSALTGDQLTPYDSNLATFTQFQLDNDLERIYEAEDYLWDAGIVFYTSGAADVSVEVYNDMPVSSQILALENFISISSSILQKYSGSFVLESGETTSVTQLSGLFTSEYQQKIDISSDILSSLENGGYYKPTSGSKSDNSRPTRKSSQDILN